jgi:hypothetical protein
MSDSWSVSNYQTVKTKDVPPEFIPDSGSILKAGKIFFKSLKTKTRIINEPLLHWFYFNTDRFLLANNVGFLLNKNLETSTKLKLSDVNTG